MYNLAHVDGKKGDIAEVVLPDFRVIGQHKDRYSPYLEQLGWCLVLY